jgi:hypothetical protein
VTALPTGFVLDGGPNAALPSGFVLDDENQEQKQPPGFLGFLNQGIASVLGAPVDLVNAGMGMVGVPVSETPFGGSASIGGGLSSLGVRVAEPGAQPQSLGEYAGRGIGGAAGALLPGAGIASALSRSASPLAQAVGQTVSRPFLATPGRALASEAAAGLGSGVGESVASNLSGGNPYAELAGSLIGGVAGGMGPNLAVRGVRQLPGVQLGEDLIAGQIAPFTERGAMQRARGRVGGLVEDADVARSLLARDTIAPLSPAVRTGDRRLIALERAVRDQEAPIDRAMRDSETEAARILREGISELGQGGSVNDTREFLNDRVRGLVTQMDDRVRQAEETARQRVAALEPRQSASQASIVVREELEAAHAAARAQEGELWRALPSDEMVPLEGALSRYNEMVSSLARAQQDDIPDAARTFLGEGKQQFKPLESVKEVHGLYSKLRTEARNSRAGDTPNRHRAKLADDMADALLQDMQSVEAASQPLREALDFSRQLNERFHRGSVGRVLGNERTGGDRVANIQTLDSTIGRSGRSGAVGYDELSRALAGSGENSSPAMQDYIASRFRDAAIRDDGIRSGPAGTFMRANEDTLQRMPDMQRSIVEALTSSETANRMRDTAAQRARGLERKSAASVVEGARPGEEIASVLRSRNPQQTAAQLARQAAKDTTGAASRGLKSAVIDDLMKSARTGRFDDADAPVMSGRAMRSRLEDDRFGPVAREIMTGEELGRVRRIADEFAALETAAGDMPSVGPIMGDQPNSMVSYLARVLAARSGAAMGAGTSGASLQTAAMASNRMQRLLQRLTNDKAEQLIIQAVSGDRELFDALLQPMSQLSKTSENRIVETLTGILGAEGGALELTVTPE